MKRGILFNLWTVPRSASCSCPFSPLFIGEYSSTPISGSTSRCHRAFQSPLHRGILFNAGGYYVEWKTATALSVPSSSGNTLQPAASISSSSFTSFFQSPLHRGILFNAARRSPLSRASHRLSVPSSSGNTLQQLFIPCRFNNLQAVF
jgi:hypothetical protein